MTDIHSVPAPQGESRRDTGGLLGTPAFSRVAAAAAIAVGALVLAGWVLDVGILKSGLPGLVAMKVNTAIGLILAGVSLWSSTGAPSGGVARLSATCAVAVGAIGVLTLGEFLTGWNLRIDEIFVAVRPTPLEPFGGRMAGNTALCLALLAVQLGRGGARLRKPWLDEGCTLLVALLASVTLAGFAFGSVPLTSIASNAQMAVHTAAALLLLCAGVLSRDRDGPLMTIVTTQGAGSLLVRRLLPAMVGSLIVLTWLQLKGREAGLFDTGFGLALMSVAVILAGGIATLWSAATLDKSGARIRWLTEAVKQNPAVIFMTNLDGTIEYVNTKFTETTGYAAAEAIGRKPSIFKSGLTPPNYYADLWATILAGHPWRGEVQNRRKNGELFWDAVMISPIRDERGVVTHFLAVQRDITDRKRADEALRESEARYRLLFESNPHPMWVVDRETYRFLAVNAAAVHHYGFSHEEFLVMTALDIRPPDDIARFKQTMTPPREGVHLSGGWRHRKKDGTVIDVEVSAHDVVFGDRQAQLVLVTDVSEQKRAEVALRESEERFRQIAEHIQEVFFLMEIPTGRVLYLNPTFEKAWGIPVKEVYERSERWFDGIHPEDRAIAAEGLARALARHTETTVFRILRPDASIRWVRARGFPVTGANRLVGLVEDITDRKTAQDALLLSERRLRTLFDTVNLIVLGLDADAKIAYANPFLEKLTGYSHGEMIGAAWFERFVPVAGRPPWRGVFLELLERDFHTHYENPIITKAGKERLISWHNTVVRDAEGRATGTLSIGEDITESSQLAAQLTQAQKMEAIGRLAGGVAHDFNNLLTVILGNIELMQLEPLSPQGSAQSIQEIRQAADRAVSLTRQLLAFSRRQMVEPTTFQLNDLVADLLKMLQRLIGEDVEVVTRLASDAGAVRADRGQIEQVVINLSVNARDAMPNGGRLTLETETATLDEEYARAQGDITPGEYAVLAVTDTGSGMTPEVRARVFEPFFTTKEHGKGTGLGLATSYGIVKQSGGHFSVYSELGLGTTMRVYLPCVVGKISHETPTQAPPLPRGSETILLVEDEAAVRDVAARTLASLGYRVLTAPDGEEALRMAAAKPNIDLLLTDVVMPRMGGRELAERIVAIAPNLKILFATGYTDDAILQHRLSTHGVKVIQKPFTRESLARKVREALDGPRQP